MSVNWFDVNKQITKIANLEADWDGEGSLPIPAEKICSARLLASVLELWEKPIPYDVYPLSDGNIIFEWRGEKGVIHRLEIESDGTGELMTTSPESNTTFCRWTWPNNAFSESAL